MFPSHHFDVEQIQDVTLIRLNGPRMNQRLMINGLRADFSRLLANKNPLGCSAVASRYIA